MRTRLTLRPGQNGTKKLLKQYGERLICVRYLYDAAKRRRYKTIELVVEDVPWMPKAARLKPDDRVLVRVSYRETDLRYRIKALGAKWDSTQRLWQVPWHAVQVLQIEARVVKLSRAAASERGCG